MADECAFWTEAAAAAAAASTSNKGGRGGTHTPASFFARTLGKIAPRFTALRQQSRLEFSRLVEDAQDACTALWLGDPDDDEFGGALVARAASNAASADAYPEARMVHLLSLIGRQMVWYWCDNLNQTHSASASAATAAAAAAAASAPGAAVAAAPTTAVGLLHDSLPEVRQSLAAALKTLAQWDGALGDFMRTWPRWQGAKFSDAGACLMLSVRNLPSRAE